MKPPAPGPVSGGSATNDMSTAATAASTALPPSRSTSTPAWAVSGWPAATTPLMSPRLAARARHELGNVHVTERSVRRPRPAHPRLGVGRHARGLSLGPRPGAHLRAVAVARGDHGDPDLVHHLLVDHRAEDDV